MERLDKRAGEAAENYVMLTMKSGAHPSIGRVHNPGPKLAPHEKDERSVIAIDAADRDAWLNGSHESAHSLIRLTALEDFDAGPDDAL